jgi:hypothetical protein
MDRNVGNQFQPSAEEQDPWSLSKFLKPRAVILTVWIPHQPSEMLAGDIRKFGKV